MNSTPIILTGTAHPALARRVAEELGTEPAGCLVDRFPNRETRVRIEADVARRPVVIIQPTSEPANDHLMELALLADAAKRAGAVRVTAVVPYFGYARQDRVVVPGEPVSAQVAVRLLAAAGVDQVVAVDLHSPASAEFLSLEKVVLEHVSARPLLASVLKTSGLGEFRIATPDRGGLPRARAFAEELTPGRAPIVIPKRRLDHATVAMDEIIGEVSETVVIVDDLIAGGGTMVQATRLLRAAGAKRIWAAATHGEFTDAASKLLAAAPIQKIIVTNSIPIPTARLPKHIMVVNLAPLLAEAIRQD